MPTFRTDTVEGPPDPRCCGRCRVSFPGEATAPIGPMPGWWSCPACSVALFG